MLIPAVDSAIKALEKVESKGKKKKEVNLLIDHLNSIKGTLKSREKVGEGLAVDDFEYKSLDGSVLNTWSQLTPYYNTIVSFASRKKGNLLYTLDLASYTNNEEEEPWAWALVSGGAIESEQYSMHMLVIDALAIQTTNLISDLNGKKCFTKEVFLKNTLYSEQILDTIGSVQKATQAYNRFYAREQKNATDIAKRLLH